MEAVEIGRLDEAYVCHVLCASGYEILARNFRIRGAEMDIIARKENILAFMEVKTRIPNSLSNGYEAITELKKTHCSSSSGVVLS
ncbi:MAG: YraN family protein [Ruminococcus sp.]|nr:YraN family protein [Ruminococcus sp.]